jgi:tetratricopeptide (TPR) repeat protein
MGQPGVLNVIGGNDRGKQFPLTLPETRIGRGTDQDVILSDIAVSRRHFTIVMEGARYKVRDLGSGNGTLVNGQRVREQLLNNGDHIEIGQTVMRFDHVDSIGVGKASPNMPTMAEPRPAPVLPPPAGPQMHVPTFSPQPAPMMPPPQQQRPMFTAPPGPAPAFPIETPSDAVSMPTGMPQRVAPYTGATSSPSTLSTLLDTRQKQLLVFGAMGFLCVVSLITILMRTAFAKAPVVPSEAEELYKQGLKAYAGADYDRAKVVFEDALKLAPDSADAQRYVALCDVEVRAKTLLKTAERAFSSRQYSDGVKALEGIDPSSSLRAEAQRLRKENVGRAAQQEVDAARRSGEDVETAKAHVARALELDPGNEDAQSLAAKLRSGTPVATKEPEPEPEPQQEKEPPSRPEKVAKTEKHRNAPPPKDELAPIKVKPEKTPPASAGGGGTLSGAVLAAYKSKDFATADRLERIEAVKQTNPKESAKTLETANQIRALKALLDKAEADESKAPEAALKEYNDAIAIDARLGKGVHAAFLKQKVGKAEVAAAQAAFNAGKYDVAYSTVTSAQRHGAGDGGLLKQLDAKAGELVAKGQGLAKSNVNQAKTYWRMVVHMVPTTSPNYAKAYSLLNAGGGPHKDEDEN